MAQLRGELDYALSRGSGRPSGRGPRRRGSRRAPAPACRASTSVIPSPEPVRPKVRRDPAPERPPLLDRHQHGVHPEQRDPAQDERQHRRLEARPAGVARRRDRRAGPQRPQHVRQRRAADRVDRARPAPRLERPRALRGDLVARHDAGRAQRAQPVLLVGLAGRRPDLVAARRQDRDRAAADAAARPGHERPARRPGAGRAPRAPRRTSRQ